ncbi:MAG TPA: peroxide stress protein YaaA [Rhodocyclaceae bacterium]|nr:peroxide stress protein YaaA [Rhodocyclaceae bacterium]HMZ84534.1 peroxide stress protein YaaA [Rhodocyclaceae bacterium]HNB79323.1 peroxide stress protein YaaA [Rhodocyclaceae bacterium]HNC61831.1 peroxide stress protein YaaA [Rhodocyclaceae bacterium]HNH13318.1 peroxide stress protein YaaA [Rhodocyclaceae bacterium]
MIFVLSPAKTLDFETPPTTRTHTQPEFLDHSAQLIALLRKLSPADVAALMDISDPLAALNVARYDAWSPPFRPANAKQAVLAFDGDVYDGLRAPDLRKADLDYAQKHLRILSGLYGLLRPLDLMQPYRLEMGTKLANPRGKDLYAFWGERQTEALNALLAKQKNKVLVNLASEEYFKSVKPKRLAGRLLTPVFEEWKGGRYKIVSFFAKKARGLMARYAIVNRIDTPEGLQGFDYEGYAFDRKASNDDTFVFRRRQEA